MKFLLQYWEDDGWLVGRLLEKPGVISQGESFEELVENIRDAFECMSAYEREDDLEKSAKTVMIELEA
jgi:predicted RNase H-like HicB family nuclease